MTTHYHPIMKHPTEQQVNYWLNRIHCGVLRTDSEKWTTACRKFHDMCAVDMLANIRLKSYETNYLRFRKKVQKEVVEQILHLVNRLIGAHQLLADQDDIANINNGISLHVELEEEFTPFLASIVSADTIPKREKTIVAELGAYVENYFFHFHNVRVPIVPGEKAYWEEYHFGIEEEINEQWRIGEAKRKREVDDDSSSESEDLASIPASYQRIRRHEQQVVAKHESYVTNYFMHFHHTHVPIVPGEKEKYWEEYHFGFEKDISDEWRIAGEAKRKRKTDKGNKKSAKKAK